MVMWFTCICARAYVSPLQTHSICATLLEVSRKPPVDVIKIFIRIFLACTPRESYSDRHVVTTRLHFTVRVTVMRFSTYSTTNAFGRHLNRWRTILRLESLERRDVPSAFKLGAIVQVSGLSPFANNTADNVPGQPGINYLNSEVEPSLAVDPTNPNHLVAAWQQDRWSTTGARSLVDAVSFNGGNTWTAPIVVPGISLVSGGVTQRNSDPWLSIGTNGVVYLSGNPFDITDGFETMSVSKSTDGGLTWGQPTALITDTSLNVIDDKESVTSDPTNSQFVYVTWERIIFPNGAKNNMINGQALVSKDATGPTWFARSTDGGNTYEPARIIFDPGNQAQTIGNQIVVEPNGDLIDVFNLIFFKRDNGGIRNNNVAFMRSTDHGLTWSAPTIISPLQSIADIDPNTGQSLRTGNILPEVALDRNNGNLYVVWEDARFSGGTHNDIAFSMSTNEGASWSAPIKINRTPTNIPLADQQAFTANIAVGGDGTIAVTYYDIRNNTGGPGLPTDFWINHVDPGNDPTNPASWNNEQRLTVNSFNIELAPTSNSSGSGFFTGDYESLAAFGNGFTSFGALWSNPTSTDPGNVYFRDPPGGVTLDSTMLAAASRTEQAGDQTEAPAVASSKPAHSIDLRPFVPVALDNTALPNASSDEPHVPKGPASDRVSEASLGVDGLDSVFAQDGIDI
jgi:hypothetical protein